MDESEILKVQSDKIRLCKLAGGPTQVSELVWSHHSDDDGFFSYRIWQLTAFFCRTKRGYNNRLLFVREERVIVSFHKTHNTGYSSVVQFSEEIAKQDDPFMALEMAIEFMEKR